MLLTILAKRLILKALRSSENASGNNHMKYIVNLCFNEIKSVPFTSIYIF